MIKVAATISEEETIIYFYKLTRLKQQFLISAPSRKKEAEGRKEMDGWMDGCNRRREQEEEAEGGNSSRN